MRKYSIKVYDVNMKLIAFLGDAYDIKYELKLNALWTCSFKLPKKSKKIRYCDIFNFVELFDGDERVELFRIMPQVLNKSNTAYIEFECEHVLSTLFDDVLFKYNQIGNLGVYTDKVIRYILDGQTVKRWQLIECDFKRQFEYKWENENLLSALFSIPKCFNEKYKWVFNTEKYPWGLSLKKLNDKFVADIQYKKNLQNIEKTVDPTNIATRIYALGFGEGDNQLDIKKVNNGVPYIEKNTAKYGIKSTILVDRRYESPETLKEYAETMLNEISEPYISYKIKTVDLYQLNKKKYNKFLPGDTVLIRDVEEQINLTIPIISVSKSDVTGNQFDIDIEIANKKQNIAGSISELQERARINDTYAQGATNLMQMSFVDNADFKYPAKLTFYIPFEMSRINKLLLNYDFEDFRAYSKAIKGGGARESTTEWNGGDYTSTDWGGGDYTSTDSGGGDYTTTGIDEYLRGSDGGHNHGISSGSMIAFSGGGSAYFYQSGNHEHTVKITGHNHSVKIPSHNHSVKIPSHKHEYTLPDHIHDIDYGMYEGGSATEAHLKIDGKTVSIYDKEVDIIPYLKKDGGGRITRGTWHTIEIIPNKLTRINASLFIQLFTTSRGGGDF